MTCRTVRSVLSQHLDGVLEISRRRQVDQHLAACSACKSEFSGLRQTRTMLSSVGRKAAPEDVALRLRLALSREAATVRVDQFAMFRFRMETAFNAFMVPATAGLLSAIVFFGLLIGFFALPSNKNDVPVSTNFYTPPELAISPFGLTDSVSSDSVVVEAYIDANGRVQDYRVLSSPEGSVSDIDPRIKNMLIFTIFRPATSYGRPTAGKAVLSFSQINVKG
jgi:Putative zinc-finger